MTASTVACCWTVIVRCSASATQTALCAATFGNRFYPMLRSCKCHWKACLSASANIVARNFQLMESEHTVPNSVRSLPDVSRMHREYENSETGESNHFTLRISNDTRSSEGILRLEGSSVKTMKTVKKSITQQNYSAEKLAGGHCLWETKKKRRAFI